MSITAGRGSSKTPKPTEPSAKRRMLSFTGSGERVDALSAVSAPVRRFEPIPPIASSALNLEEHRGKRVCVELVAKPFSQDVREQLDFLTMSSPRHRFAGGAFSSFQAPGYPDLWLAGLFSFLSVQMQFLLRGLLAWNLTERESALGLLSLIHI